MADDEPSDDAPRAIEVLEENWDAVQVFTRCRQSYVAGMNGAFATGLCALEVEAGCRLAGVHRRRWPETSDHVLHMGAVAAEILNARRH